MSLADQKGAAHSKVGRWIFFLLFGFAFLGYVQRTSVAIVAERMMPELGLSQIEVGWLLTSFLLAYTIFQLPSAVIGEWMGVRRSVTVIGIVTVLATWATAAAPNYARGGSLLVALMLARFTLGVGQAALFPVASGAIVNWCPVVTWGAAQGLLATGLWLGSAATPPTVAWLMDGWGWRSALIVTSIPMLLIVVVWHWYSRDRPAEHWAVSAAEFAELAANPAPASRSPMSAGRVLRILKDPQVLLITASYFLTNYVFYLVTFWCFLYLVQERHFAVLESSWLATSPFLVAAVATAAGGRLSDRLRTRLGERMGTQILPIGALPAAALFLILTGSAANAYYAIVALCIAFACVELTEGPYWAVTMRLVPNDVMAGTAVLNTGGNLGGVVATPIIAALSAGHHWMVVFGTGGVLSLTAAALWFWIEPDRAAATSNTCMAA